MPAAQQRGRLAGRGSLSPAMSARAGSRSERRAITAEAATALHAGGSRVRSRHSRLNRRAVGSADVVIYVDGVPDFATVCQWPSVSPHWYPRRSGLPTKCGVAGLRGRSARWAPSVTGPKNPRPALYTAPGVPIVWSRLERTLGRMTQRDRPEHETDRHLGLLQVRIARLAALALLGLYATAPASARVPFG